MADQAQHVKEQVTGSLDETKKAGEEKLDHATQGNKPSVTDQAKEKGANAKAAVLEAPGKAQDALADTWEKTKEAVSNVNQYPDKK